MLVFLFYFICFLRETEKDNGFIYEIIHQKDLFYITTLNSQRYKLII